MSKSSSSSLSSSRHYYNTRKKRPYSSRCELSNNDLIWIQSSNNLEKVVEFIQNISDTMEQRDAVKMLIKNPTFSAKNRYKTSLCEHIKKFGICPIGSNFVCAHSEQEIRPIICAFHMCYAMCNASICRESHQFSFSDLPVLPLRQPNPQLIYLDFITNLVPDDSIHSSSIPSDKLASITEQVSNMKLKIDHYHESLKNE